MSREESGVLDQVEDVILFSMLQGKAPHVRADILKELILETLPLGGLDKKDEQVSFLFKLYMDSLSESIEDTGSGGAGLGGKVRDFYKAQILRDDAARIIWHHIPATFVSGGQLSALRLLVLTEIVNYMAVTQDESEADARFEFLNTRNLLLGINSEDFLKVLRASRKQYFPLARMNRFLRILLAHKKRIGYDSFIEALIDIFSHGIYQKAGHEVMEKYFRIMSPVANGSPAIFNLIEEDVKKAGELEAKAQSLIDAVSWTPQSPTRDEYETRIDRSHMELSFVDFETIVLESHQKGIPREYALANKSEKVLHAQFEGVKKRIQKWLSENPGIKVRLFLTATQAYQDEPFFSRGPVEVPDVEDSLFEIYHP